MMRRIIRAYLSLTRGERNGFILLALLLMLLMAGRAILPFTIARPLPDFEDADSAFLAFRSTLESAGREDRSGHGSHEKKRVSLERSRPTFRYFHFDPNRIGYRELLELGLSDRVAKTLISYRNSGGKFNNKQDLLKVYGLGASEYDRLEPYIRIGSPDPTDGKKHEVVPLELNGSDSLQLREIYGIGPVFARRIIRYRDLLGGYYAREQLKEVYGLGEAQYQEMIGKVCIDTSRLRRMDLNRVERRTLARHPYLTSYQADALMAYREYKGKWQDIGEIMQHQLIPDSVYRRIRPYLTVGE
jgi:competence protein ComEA